jgi:predicted phage terminase large subunit-like protein
MSPATYDVAEIESFRRDNKSWQAICKHYHVQYPAAYRWYKRALKKLEKGEKLKTQKTSKVVAVKTKSKLILQKKAPTGYISKLNHTEWANKYCGHFWKVPYLSKLSKFIWRGNNVFAFLPRGHGKTLRIVALVCRFLLEVQRPVLVITGGPANQRRIWNAIRRVCTSKQVLEDYGNVFESFSGNIKEANFVPELQHHFIDPALAIVTRQGEVVGRHPAWIHLEDIIQEPFKSHESNIYLQEWFSGIVEFCATHEKGYETRITGTGTRKALDDFYAYVLDELRYIPYIEEAVKLLDGEFPSVAEVYEETDEHDIRHERVDCATGEFQTLDCPAWPLERLLIFRIFRPMRFEAEMQNHPLPTTGTYFDPTDMMYYEELPTPKDTVLSISCDPSFGRKAGSDYTAIVVVGWQSTMDRFYIFEHFLKKSMTYNDIIDQICEIYFKYNRLGYPIRSITVESNLYQRWLLDGFKGIPIPIEGIESQANKIERIASLQPVLKRHMLFFNENLAGYRQVLAQITQFDQTPSTATKKDDFLDALQTALTKLQIVLHRKGKSWSQR